MHMFPDDMENDPTLTFTWLPRSRVGLRLGRVLVPDDVDETRKIRHAEILGCSVLVMPMRYHPNRFYIAFMPYFFELSDCIFFTAIDLHPRLHSWMRGAADRRALQRLKRTLAFSMTLHRRLGSQCAAKVLPEDAVRMIAIML